MSLARERGLKAAGAAEELVFRKGLPTMQEFRADLKAAKIPLLDAQGRWADFHALRHTFCTNLARAGVPLQVAKQLMRHSDVRLTVQTYTDTGLLPLEAGVAVLPPLRRGRNRGGRMYTKMCTRFGRGKPRRVAG